MENDTTTFLLVEDDRNDVALFRMEFSKGSANLRLQVVQDGARPGTARHKCRGTPRLLAHPA